MEELQKYLENIEKKLSDLVRKYKKGEISIESEVELEQEIVLEPFVEAPEVNKREKKIIQEIEKIFSS